MLNFTTKIPPATWQCTVNWVDVDGNFYPDMFMCSPWQCKLYNNTVVEGTGFIDITPSAISSLTGTATGSSHWADYNKDGTLDLFVTGLTETGASAALIAQGTDKTFTNTCVFCYAFFSPRP